MDTGATDHITGELNKLHTHDTYRGREQVHDASGKGMMIKHVGHSILHTPHSSIQLRNILHFPSSSKSLLSAHKIALDNNVFVEFHPFFFLIKDQAMKQTMFRVPVTVVYILLCLAPPDLPRMLLSPSSRLHPHGIVV
jgi:hypothetical protein